MVICGAVRSWFWCFGEDFWRSSGMSAKWAVTYGVCLMCAQWAHKGLVLEIVFWYNVKKKGKNTSMSEIVRMAFRVDKELKTEAEKVFKQMGMSSTAAMKVFLAQCVR